MSRRFACLAFVIVAFVAGPAPAAVVLVDDDAPPGGDGQSWATAYQHVQDALTAARNSGGAITEIWVAAGTYKPDQGQNQTPGDRNATFLLVENVALRGGFAGNEDPATFDPADRDPAMNETILSGEIGLTDETYDNSYHVVTGADDATLDGFTITAGEAGQGQDGGGMYSYGVSSTVIDCIFRENWASARGAGMYNGTSSSPMLIGCTFERNGLPRPRGFGTDPAHGLWTLPDHGGGIYNDTFCRPTMIDCVFIENTAEYGGGACNNGSEATLANCEFIHNSSLRSGGGLYAINGSLTLTNCRFDGNGVLPEGVGPAPVFSESGGGAFCNSPTAVMTVCTFSGNSALHGAAGLSNGGNGLTLRNSTFTRNSGDAMWNVGRDTSITDCWFTENARWGMLNSGSDVRLLHCTFAANSRGGMWNTGSGLVLTDCAFAENSSPDVGGGMLNEGASVQWTRCTFTANSAAGTSYYGSGGGGGGLYNLGNNPTWTDCIFTANATTTTGQHWGGGGGLFNHGSNPEWIGCTFARNSTEGEYSRGGGIWNYGSNPTWTDCIFSENSSAGQYGGGVHNTGDHLTMTTCLFTENSATGEASDGRADGGAMYNSGPSPMWSACTFQRNSSTQYGGGLYNSGEPARMTGCAFDRNSANHMGGGVYNNADAILSSCRFRGNSATGYGAGMYANARRSLTVTNCSFSGNSTTGQNGRGGGLHNSSYYSKLVGCTFHSNFAAKNGGGLSGYGTLINCVLWNNAGGQIYSTGTALVTYSNVQGGYPGDGNIDAPPLFRDADGPDDIIGTEDDDLRLAVGSPCIDAGDNAAVPPDTLDLDGDGDTVEPTPIDLGGGLRFINDPRAADTGSGTPPIVDMGAYELDPPPPGDCDYDGEVDAADLDYFTVCSLGPAVPQNDPACRIARLDADNDVDQADFAIFQRSLSSESVPADNGDAE